MNMFVSNSTHFVRVIPLPSLFLDHCCPSHSNQITPARKKERVCTSTVCHPCHCHAAADRLLLYPSCIYCCVLLLYPNSTNEWHGFRGVGGCRWRCCTTTHGFSLLFYFVVSIGHAIPSLILCRVGTIILMWNFVCMCVCVWVCGMDRNICWKTERRRNKDSTDYQ